MADPSSSDGMYSPPPAIRPPAIAEVAQHDLEVPVITSKFESLCCRCSHSYVVSFVPTDPEWRGMCVECEQLMWSTQEPLAAIPGCPCAVSAGAVVCICGRRASEHHCPDKENHALQSAVRKKTVPLTASAHIIICLICEQTFKHHRNFVKHMQVHHTHFHSHHGP
jgi:hypothetical protein